MKLLSKTTLLILTVSLFIFMVGNVVFFQVSKKMISKHIDNELIMQMHSIIDQINEDESLFQITKFSNEVVIDRLEKDISIKSTFSDTVLFSEIQKRYIPHRSLKFSHQSQSRNQLITIYKSLLSSDKLIERITISSIVMVLIFIIMIYIMNRFVFTNVWSDFFSNLKIIEHHDIKSMKKIELSDSEIDEFTSLNKVMSEMVDRIQLDYLNLKELTANTSHEIQTPLAIIKNKAEMLLQSENLNEQEMQEVYSILNTSNRLSKINQSLLLISKIENNQYSEFEIIDVQTVLNKHLQNFLMLAESSNRELISDIQPAMIKINPILFDMLVINLIKNALSHSSEKAKITVDFKEACLTITNDGEALPFDEDQLFKRFMRNSTNKSSNGLGLEIVKKICRFHNLEITYSFEAQKHIFKVDFNKIIV